MKRALPYFETITVFLLLFTFFGAHMGVLRSLLSLIKPLSYVLLTPLIFLRWKEMLYAIAREKVLVLLVLLASASWFWSVDAESTADALKALIRATLLGTYIAARFSLKSQIQLIGTVIAFGAVLSLLFRPTMLVGNNIDHPWLGTFGFKNLFACVMVMGIQMFLLSAWQYEKHRLGLLILAALNVGLLFLSQGKTSMLVLLISVVFLPLIGFIRQNYKLRTAFALIFGLLLLIVAGLFIANLQLIVVDWLNKDMNFNGRTQIWQLMLDKISQRPVLGYGYAGFWGSDEANYVIQNTWASARGERTGLFNAHNGYLDLMVQLGFLGLGLFLIQLVQFMNRTIKLLALGGGVLAVWVFLFIVSMVLLNLADTIAILAVNSLWSVYVSLSISTSLKVWQVEQQQLRSKLQAKLAYT